MSRGSLRQLHAELAAIAPDDWPRLSRAVTVRRDAAELLAALDRPPSPLSRLGWELHRRVEESLNEAA